MKISPDHSLDPISLRSVTAAVPYPAIEVRSRPQRTRRNTEGENDSNYNLHSSEEGSGVTLRGVHVWKDLSRGIIRQRTPNCNDLADFRNRLFQ
ncbi:MAG: hypothetical protein H6Q52_2773 [Deltaproteobacteria bacterium]|nr:hypothetical protein [Deltaproteobacteria bacterium]